VFTWQTPRQIARSLQLSAERYRRRKTDAFRSAMSMLTFYINRAGGSCRRAAPVWRPPERAGAFGRPRRRAAGALPECGSSRVRLSG
jgi:hypothetical protein